MQKVIGFGWGRRLAQTSLAVATLCSLTLLHGSLAGASYNGSQAAAYADQYWQGYNYEYPLYSDDCTNFVSQALNYNGRVEGGKPFIPSYLTSPLANYPSIISDPTNPGYWYGEPTNLATNQTPYNSNTWTVAESLFWLLESYDGSNSSWVTDFHYYGGNTAPSEPAGMAVGDVFFYNWDAFNNGLGANGISHATILTYQGSGTDGTVGDQVDAHTTSRYHVFWTLKFVSNPTNANVGTEEVYGVHISG